MARYKSTYTLDYGIDIKNAAINAYIKAGTTVGRTSQGFDEDLIPSSIKSVISPITTANFVTCQIPVSRTRKIIGHLGDNQDFVIECPLQSGSSQYASAIQQMAENTNIIYVLIEGEILTAGDTMFYV